MNKMLYSRHKQKKRKTREGLQRRRTPSLAFFEKTGGPTWNRLAKHLGNYRRSAIPVLNMTNGIGAIVNIKGTKTHQTAEDALKIIENLEHQSR